MKQKHFIFTIILATITFAFIYVVNQSNSNQNIEELRAQHKMAFENSPFKTTKNLSKEERNALALPPNAYNEQMWELTMDPQTGRPMTERLMEIRDQLKIERENNRGVGGDAINPWIDRGPNNQGGRTRGLMFDPNDVGGGNGDGIDYNRVFAGSVSGGLWVNNDITSSSSSWTLVPGIGANISVTVIISDPNNLNTFYIGAGESYASGDAVGRGIWKSTDAGVTWTNVFGGYTGTSTPGGGGVDQHIHGIFYINDLVARDIGATTELYASVAGAFFGDAGTNPQWHSLVEQGLYKSTNNGTSWSKISLWDDPPTDSFPINPNDIELDISNNIWLSTTSSSWGFAGGKIFQSTNGTTFNLINTIASATRTEIEPSATAVGTFWIAANVAGVVELYTTTNAFTSYAAMTAEPNDADAGIPATDYTRGQAFWDLPIESDASGNLIVGGIDLFRSTDNGTTWPQISRWNNTISSSTSVVHADQHAIIQRPGAGNANQYIFGTDGGVFYTADITLAAGSTTNIATRNKDYNTIQFYYGAIDPVDGGDGDDLIGGTQDNGTQFLIDGVAGANPYFDPVGGDGGYTEIDDSGLYMVQTYPRNTHNYIDYPTISTLLPISTPGPDAISPPNCNTSNGSFINEADLDKNLNILYSNATFSTFVCADGTPVSTTYRIERVAEFLPGAPAPVRTMLSDGLLNANPTAFKVSSFTGGSTKLFIGLANGRLLRIDTADGTPAWNNITGPSFLGSISDIEFGGTESEIFVTMFNYGVTSIWFTSDGGTNWVSKEGNLPDLPVRCILQNPLITNEVIVGTDLGVWATGDYTQGSPNWIQTYNGMSDVTVVDLDLRSADDVILASTHGRGFFTSQFTSVTLSVAENSFNSDTVSIFPTVSDGKFTLTTQRSLGNITFSVYDITGKEVYGSNFDLTSNRRDFNIDLSSGLYIIKIKSDNSAITKRIIIE